MPWCQSGGSSPLGPTDKAQDPVLEPSPQEAAHKSGPPRRAQETRDSPVSTYGKLRSPRWVPASQDSLCLSICLGTKVPAIPESPGAHSLQGSGVGLLSAL